MSSKRRASSFGLRLWLLTAVAAALLSARVATAAEVYRHDAAHFKVTLPEGWGRVTDEAIALTNEEVKKIASVHYEAGFQVAGTPSLSYPYVLVQIQEVDLTGAGASFDDLEKQFAKGMNTELKSVESKLPVDVKNLAFGQAVFDRTRKRVMLRTSLDVPPVGKVSGVSYGMVGAKGLVFLHCYATAPEFETAVPTFNTLADSFAFDPSYEFVPGKGVGGIARGAVSGGIRGGIIGGLIGAVVAVVMVIKKGKKKA